MDVRNTLSLAGGLLVLGAVGYFWGGFGKSESVLQANDNAALPDYEVHGIQGLQTDEQGQIRQRLRATVLQHYPTPERSLLQQPQVDLYQDGQLLWQISAHEGSSDANQKLRLQGEVTGRRSGELGLSLHTDYLVADQRAQTLFTDAPVSIRATRGQLDSLGLQANLRAHTLDLPAQVRGTYLAPPR